MNVAIIIPARNESAVIAAVVAGCAAGCPAGDAWRVVVCDNGSTDDTAERAARAGAEVVREDERGYGAACLRAIAHVGAWPDAHLFVDGDGAADPGDLTGLLNPLRRGQADLAIGWRRAVEHGAMTGVQDWGTRGACALLGLRFGGRHRDLGPLRAITAPALRRLGMTDRTWGWTLEMQIKAALAGLRVVQTPVRWRRRAGGCSKISGTVRGALRAGGKILYTFARHGLRRRWAPPAPPDVVLECVKYPDGGQVKTRLAAGIGSEAAVRVYRRLCARTHRELLHVRDAGLAATVVYGDGAACERMQRWLPGAADYWQQPPGGLGGRLAAGFARAFAGGARRVAVVGGDSPDLDAAAVIRALGELQNADAVMIPVLDGGYALLALRRPRPELFEGIAWGTAAVAAQTRARAAALGVSLIELPAVHDVDEPHDLQYLPPLLSIVLPAESGPHTPEHRLLAGFPAAGAGADEVEILSDDVAATGEWILFLNSGARLGSRRWRGLLERLMACADRDWGWLPGVGDLRRAGVGPPKPCSTRVAGDESSGQAPPGGPALWTPGLIVRRDLLRDLMAGTGPALQSAALVAMLRRSGPPLRLPPGGRPSRTVRRVPAAAESRF